jgi:hypothetical protein
MKFIRGWLDQRANSKIRARIEYVRTHHPDEKILNQWIKKLSAQSEVKPIR